MVRVMGSVSAYLNKSSKLKDWNTQSMDSLIAKSMETQKVKLSATLRVPLTDSLME